MTARIAREDIEEKIACAKKAQEEVFHKRRAVVKQAEELLAQEEAYAAKIAKYERALGSFDFMLKELDEGART